MVVLIAMPRSFVVPAFLAINLLVFLLWMKSPTDPWMSKNFLVSGINVLTGHWWVLLTAVFSHNLFWHFLMNMVVLKSFGTIMERVLGSGVFFVFYIVAGIFSSMVHCLVSIFVLRAPDLSALGASGALCGVVMLFAILFPREKILLFWFIPLPAIVGAFAFVGLDLWGLYAQAEGGGLPIGHGAHLGGAFAGLVFGILIHLRRHLLRQS